MWQYSSRLVGEHADVFARLPPGAHRALLHEYIGTASSPARTTIDVPVVVCWGEDDTWVPLERGRELAARIPVRTCGSSRAPATSSPRTTPAELTAALVEFLHDLP